jgi:hypothetical protein
VNVKGSYVFVDFTVLDTQDDGEMALILGRPFLRYVNARIDVGAEKIQFCIRQRNMTFKIHEKEEQCCLVQNEESREWRKPQPQYKEDEVAPTKPKVDSLITAVRKHWEQDKAFKGRHKPKKSKAIKKARGGEEDGNQKHLCQSLTDVDTTKENKEGVACEGSIVRVINSGTGSGIGRIQAQANGGVPLTDSKLWALTTRKTGIYLIFPFQHFYFVDQAYLNLKFDFTIASVSKQDIENNFRDFWWAEPRGTAIPALDKIIVEDVYRRGHECLEQID